MFRHPDPEVLVVGAGPVGLVAALFLQQHGVRVEIVDTHKRTTQHSYALAIHPRTLRVLDEAGLSEGLIGAGRKLTKVAYYEGPERRAEIDYSALASEHPYLLVLRQSRLERAAEEALRQKKLEVLWGHRLESLDADDATLRAEVAKLDQVATGYPVARSEWVVVRSDTIRPTYVIGADGYDSAVRRMAGIEMEEHGAGQIFSIYEIVLGLWLLTDKKTFHAASLAALTMTMIIIFNLSALDLVFRDVAILFAALALAALHHKNCPTTETKKAIAGKRR